MVVGCVGPRMLMAVEGVGKQEGQLSAINGSGQVHRKGLVDGHGGQLLGRRYFHLRTYPIGLWFLITSPDPQKDKKPL